MGVPVRRRLADGSPALTDGRLLRALAGLRDRGVRVGLSTSGPDQGETVLRAPDVTVDGQLLFTSVETTWNLLEPAAGPALAQAAAAGATVIVKEVVANGRLVPGVPDPAPAAVVARQVARRLGVGPDQVAVAAALAQPWAWPVLSGAVTSGQLAENLGGEGLVLDRETVARLLERPEPAERYWAERSARPWL